MRKPTCFILGFVTCCAAIAGILPQKPAELSSTQLISIQRLETKGSEQGPDGLSFCFLVSRTATAQHKLAIKETRDFLVSKRSYREVSQASLGRVFEPQVAVHDASKYAADHPELAPSLTAAPPKSLVVVVAISGSKLEAGSDVEVRLHIGFGRSADKPEAEELVFRTKVP